MLFSTVINDTPNELNNDWGIESDKYGNNFIVHKNSKQNIRLSNNVSAKLDEVYNYSYDADCISTKGFEIANNIFISNSNKNMNLSIMNFWSEDPKLKGKHNDQNILYITFSNKNRGIVSYNSYNHEIVKTYTRINEHQQGCTILFDNSDTKDLLFTIVYYSKTEKCKSKINIYKDIDNKVKVEKVPADENDPDYSKTKLVKKKNGKSVKTKVYVDFRIRLQPGKLATAVYLVNPEYSELMNELTKDIANAVIIETTTQSFYSSGDEKKEFDRIMNEYITKERVRAITTVGVKVPKNFYKDYKILYAFDYIPKIKKLVCTKSN